VETALGTSAFLMEDVEGSETALRAYYRLLNCGFRPGLAAGTDYPCNKLQPFGTLLTYVSIPSGRLTYRSWIEGLAKGRTVVSRNGHDEFLDLKLNGIASPGDEVHLSRKGTVQVDVQWSATKSSTGTIELIRDGTVVASQPGSASLGVSLAFRTSQEFVRSGWICARRMDEKGHQTHTGAAFIIVDGAPVRVNARDAEYFVHFIDSLIEKSAPLGAWNQFFLHDRQAAQTRYRKAREIFRQIALEAHRQNDTLK
jgi:hypothetical protein